MIIGLQGKMGVGKSTAFEHICKIADKPVRLVKFAGPLYEIQEFIYGRIKSVYQRPVGFTKDRKLLQWIGTDWARDTISKTLWVDLWRNKCLEHKDRGHLVVCDDVRFDNEANTIKSLGGVVVKISAENTEKRIDTTSGIAYHASEAGISRDLIDFEIKNNGSLEEFKSELSKLYSLLKGKESLNNNS